MESRIDRGARIIARSGVLELRAPGGRVLRTVVYEAGSSRSERAGRQMLIREALALHLGVQGEGGRKLISPMYRTSPSR